MKTCRSIDDIFREATIPKNHETSIRFAKYESVFLDSEGEMMILNPNFEKEVKVIIDENDPRRILIYREHV